MIALPLSLDKVYDISFWQVFYKFLTYLMGFIKQCRTNLASYCTTILEGFISTEMFLSFVTKQQDSQFSVHNSSKTESIISWKFCKLFYFSFTKATYTLYMVKCIQCYEMTQLLVPVNIQVKLNRVPKFCQKCAANMSKHVKNVVEQQVSNMIITT